MTTLVQKALAELLQKNNLSDELMDAAMREVMTGLATPAQIGGFLVALRMKGETVTEIAAAARVMRDLAAKVTIEGSAGHLVDTCGTGGDSSAIFNVSTASAFVAAAAGARVAKHGNRSVTSKSGSADLLEAAGVRLDLSPQQVSRCVQEVGVGFMFAVNHHSAMKHAIGPRRELGIRTIFNLLGPLTNPASAPNQVMGVFAREWVRPVAEVLKQLGSQHVLVVHSSDGLDEISSAAETFVAELKEGVITEYSITPGQFNIPYGRIDDLKVSSVEMSLEKVRRALTEASSPEADIVALNAGAAIYAANLCSTLAQGIHMAQDVISTGAANEKLKQLVAFSTQLKLL